MILSDFNARSTSWWIHDTKTYEGTHINALTASYDHQQIISERTHMLSNSSSSIDLMFTNQPNLVADHAVARSLHPNCYHQIIHCKFILKIDYSRIIKVYFGITPIIGYPPVLEFCCLVVLY